MQFTCTIDMDNAALGDTTDDNAQELARILRDLAGRMKHHAAPDGGKITDVNGNSVGNWTLRA